MGVRLQRNLTSRASLGAGQFYTNVMRHEPGTQCTVYVCCPRCAGVEALSPTHVINIGGHVVPGWFCPTATCGFSAFLVLESWGEALP